MKGGIKLNYVKEAEEILKSRKTLDEKIRSLNRQIARIMNSGTPHEIKGIDYSQPKVKGGAVDDTMTDCISIIEANKEIKLAKAKIEEIDDVIGQLQEESKKILTLWYIDLKTKSEICNILNYGSMQSIYDKHRRGIEEFALLYFGAPALYSI